MAITTVHNELIAVNAISGTAIADNAVTSVHIAKNNVGTVQIAQNSVTSVSIALNNVTGTQIAMNSITSTQLADNAVTATKIPDGTQLELGATNFSGEIHVGGTSVAAGTASLMSDGHIKGVLSSGGSGDTLIGAISGVSNGYQIIVDSSNNQNYKWFNGGTNSMILNSSGNVGIGTASPSTLLHLGGTAPGDSIIRQDSTSSGTNWEIGERAAGKWQIFEDDNDSIVATFMSTGNVGIGTTSPSQKLHVVGKLKLTDDLIIGGTSPRIDYDGGSTGSLRFFSTSANTERMRIESGGRVGIGTTNPDGPLHVKPASGDTYVILEAGQADGNAGLIYHNNSGTQVGYNLYDTDDNIYYIGVGGINRFTVRSGSHFELRGPDANSNQVKMMDSSGNIDGYLYAEASEIGFLDADGNWAMQVKTDNYVRFLVNNSEGGRFDSSGNLLIGTTSSAQASGTGIKLTGDDRLYMVNALTSGEQISYYGNGGYKFFVGVNGTIYSTNTSISAISDGRLKENVRDLDTGLEQVLALQPRRFDWKEGEGTGHKDVIGFVAQEVESVLPDVINDFKHDVYDDAKSIKTSDIVPTLVKAIQEQQTIIDDLKAEVAALKG